VYRIRPGRDPRGHEQAGGRYGIVVQDERLPLSTVLVVPTSTSCAPAMYRPVVQVGGQDTRAMVEQISVCDPERRFGDRVGHLTLSEMESIDTALRLILSL
jgi:mRNA interferase MazF